jgi:hypothetical protein
MDNRVGQNETAHLHDASVASGPLWCVPVATGVVAVWHGLSSDLDLIGLEGGAGLLTPIERHRIFSPQFSKNFYTVSSRGLQDGRRLRVILRSPDGVETEQALDLRLAHWQIEGTPQIVSFIISRILPKLDASGDYETLERFLSLVSSWRASAHRKTQIGSHSLYELDVATGYFAARQTCFVVRDGRLTREVVDSFASDDSCVFMTSTGHPDRAYADLGGDLVELDFSNHSVTDQNTLKWLQDMSVSAKNRLLDRLSNVWEAERTALPAYVTASLTTATFPLGEPASEIIVKGCFRASGALFAFLEVTGAATLEAVRIEVFGVPADACPTPDMLTRSLPFDGALPKLCIVAKAALDGHQASACKISLQVEGRSIQQWIHVQSGDTAAGFRFIRDFWPVADKDEDYLAEVGVPFARAWVQRPVKETVLATSLSGQRNSDSTVDLQVIAGAQLEPLHGTLLGLKASLPLGQALRMTLPSGPELEAAHSKLSGWAKRYELDGDLRGLPAHAPASAAADLNPRSFSRISVAIRSGFIPPRAGWLNEIVAHLDRVSDTFLVGVARNRVPSKMSLDKLDAETLLELLSHDAIVAVASSAGLMQRIVIDQPVCHTLAGSWIERIVQGLGQGMKVIPHDALGFLEIDGFCNQDIFGRRIDEIALSRKISATEHRESPIGLRGVLSA